MWILVANGSRASLYEGKRTFSAPGEFSFEPLEKLEEWSNEEARAQNQELVSDRPGRHIDRNQAGEGIGGRSGWEPREDAKTQEARDFARSLAEHLDGAVANGEADQLVLAAPPKFLGFLRDAASAKLRQATLCEITKDLSQVNVHDLRERLPDLMG